MPTVFISWSRETQPVALALTPWLEAQGVQCWCSSVDITAGTRWRDELDQALARADGAIACLGPSALRSPWVLYEAAQLKTRGGVVPLALQIDVDRLPPTLADVQVLDAFPQPRTEPAAGVAARLRQALGALLGQALDDASADHTVHAALQAYGQVRVASLRKVLKATRRSDMLMDTLRYLQRNPGRSLKSLADDAGLDEPFGKKYLVAFALFWLRENDLLRVTDFDDIAGGRVTLTYDARLLLDATPDGT